MDFLTLFLVLLSIWIAAGLLVFWIGTSLPARIDWAAVRAFGKPPGEVKVSLPVRLFKLCAACLSTKPQPGSLALVRSANRKVMPAGDLLRATLAASAHGAPSATPTEPWEVILLVDHSGSMGSGPGSPLEDAKKSILNMLHSLPKSYHLAVITFDSEARTVHPLNDKRRHLIAAIGKIIPGGGTDIAKGLEQADKIFPTDSAAAKAGKQALVLLSDGDRDQIGDRQRATDCANKIKQKGVKLFTLGLGNVDEDLLRELAGDGLYFHAHDLADLRKLYQEIGLRISGGNLIGVEINEALNVPIWRRHGFSGVTPVAHRFDGNITWMLLGLGQDSVNLEYDLEPLCPGWHRIGAVPAKLTGIQEDGQIYQGHSNAGPWVLVMPRVPGWQFWWLLLNPLYYLLRGNRQCRYAQTSRPTPELAAPRELAHPDKLQDLEPAPQLAIEPTLVLGIGYAGLHALTECKRLLWETANPKAAEQVRFLGIDTASEHYFPTPTSGTVSLQPDERLTLATQIESLIAAEAESDHPRHAWLPAHDLLSGGARPDLQRGMGQQRALGRLAWFANVDAVRTALESELQSLPSTGSALRVSVVLSSGSGSGGMLIDLCWQLRQILNRMGQPNATISVFLMPPFGQGHGGAAPPAAQLQRDRNHAALMGELERITTAGAAYSPGEGFDEERGLTDHVLLVGPARPQRESQVHRDLYPRCGEALFAWMSSEGLRHSFQTALIGTAIHRLEPASIYLYPRTLQEWLCLDGMAALVEQGLLGGASDPSKTAVDNFYESLQTRLPPESGRALETLPWFLLNLKYLPEAPEELKKRLASGGGPLLGNRIDNLDIENFMEEQEQLTQCLLRARICDALNEHGNEGAGLSVVRYALQDLTTRIDAVLTALAGFGAPANGQFSEADAAHCLASMTRRRVDAWTSHLLEWEAFIGQGGETHSVLGRLRRRISTLRLAVLDARETASPRLTVDDSALESRRKQWLPQALDKLLPRLRWQAADPVPSSPTGGAPKLNLNIYEDSPRTIELPPRRDANSIDSVIDSLLDIMGRWTQGFKKLSSTDYVPNGWTFSISTPSNAGQFLTQGDARPPTPHLPCLALDSDDRAVMRLMAVDPTPLREAWRIDAPLGAKPYVLLEEFHAYRIQSAYLLRRGLAEKPIEPRVVALFRDPNKLRHFIVTGLLAGTVAQEFRDGRAVWTDGQDILAGASARATDDFFAVAYGYLARNLPPMYSTPAALDRARLLAHPLLSAINPSEQALVDFADMAEAMLEYC